MKAIKLESGKVVFLSDDVHEAFVDYAKVRGVTVQTLMADLLRDDGVMGMLLRQTLQLDAMARGDVLDEHDLRRAGLRRVP